MRAYQMLGIGVAALVAAAACGTNEDLFRGDDDPTPTGTGATGGTGGAAGAGTTTGTTTGTPTGSGGAGGTETGTPTGAGGAGGSEPTIEIPCTNEVCTGGQVCCISYLGTEFDHCSAPGTCGDQAVEAACDGPDDCPGSQICCGRWVSSGGSGYYTEVLCSPTCEDGGGSLGVVLCETPADCPGNFCIPSQWLPDGYSYCE